MNDMRPTIVPKSDQKNADDFLTGPLTIKVREVTIRPGTEQPCSIFYEGDGGKPYKPCKSMARVLVNAWGPDANKYVGRSMTLYCDPKVTWAGMAVGGIRISHMSHIDREMLMALTATKGKKAPFTVKPMLKQAATKAAEQPQAPEQPATSRADAPHGADQPVYEARNGQGEIVGMFTAPLYLVEIDRLWADAAAIGSAQEFAAIHEHNTETIDALPVDLKEALRKSYALHKRSFK